METYRTVFNCPHCGKLIDLEQTHSDDAADNLLVLLRQAARYVAKFAADHDSQIASRLLTRINDRLE